jgi:predicted transposase YdaD
LEGDEAKTEARAAIERSAGDRDIIEMITKIVVYKFNSLSRDEVNVMLGIELQQTRVYQEAKAEGKVEGKAEGKAEEREIGLQRERALIIKLLSRKLGNLSTQLQAEVSARSIDDIELLGEALLDFNSLADLESWLRQN